MSEIAIGIDLGTSNSCVAVREGDDTRVLANAYGERTTASVVFFQQGGSISVGNAARSGLIHDPARTIASAKRLIGRFYGSEEVKKAQAICSYKIVEGDNRGVEIEAKSSDSKAFCDSQPVQPALPRGGQPSAGRETGPTTARTA